MEKERERKLPFLWVLNPTHFNKFPYGQRHLRRKLGTNLFFYQQTTKGGEVVHL